MSCVKQLSAKATGLQLPSGLCIYDSGVLLFPRPSTSSVEPIYLLVSGILKAPSVAPSTWSNSAKTDRREPDMAFDF